MKTMKCSTVYFVLLLVLLSAGCSNSSDRSSPTEFNLPSGSSSFEVDLVDAFPSLSFSNPVYVTHSGDGTDRLFVVEQRGTIQVFTNDSDTVEATLFLDIQDRVTFDGEMGLLGLAFDPNLETSGEFYVYYIAGSPRRSVLSRFTVSENQADVNSEQVILELAQPYSNHNGGTILFGQDGYLYLGLGDGGSGGDPLNSGQDTSTLLGSILRIDPQSEGYSVPEDNPFVGQDGFMPEIWAYGFRNPYRFSMDRETGDIWIGDVGQGSVEEIDLLQKGGNFGWNHYEGTDVYGDVSSELSYLAPVFEYGHDEGVSITGGNVYRGSDVPALQGQYIYGDFGYQTVWALSLDENNQAIENRVIAVEAPDKISGFGEDEAGELYLVGYNGKIYRFANGENMDPLQGFPDKLSETGLFIETASLTPQSSLQSYTVQSPLWSDGAEKQRWIYLPPGEMVGFSETEAWDFPIGTVLVKHFDMPLEDLGQPLITPLETRILVRKENTWVGATYRWNETLDDAHLLQDAVFETISVATEEGVEDREYYFPSSNDCVVCHHEKAGRVLGVRTEQLNGDVDLGFDGVINQITFWQQQGLLNGFLADTESLLTLVAVDDKTQSLETRARSYLAANCSFCHQPGGTTTSNMDLRMATPLAETNVLDAIPQSGDLGIADARIVQPGERASSVLWLRMQALDDNRMPPLASHTVDEEALSVIGDWIDQL